MNSSKELSDEATRCLELLKQAYRYPINDIEHFPVNIHFTVNIGQLSALYDELVAAGYLECVSTGTHSGRDGGFKDYRVTSLGYSILKLMP